jgi:nucleoid DNA-binding protein
MDIAKYIGLFLLKNNFVYLHGLGNLELKKRQAAYEGETLTGPEYDVVLTPGGSIDDTLANYIATHEQTSISKAANALRDYSTAARADLAAGKEVEIPGIGTFVETSGIIRFRSNPHLKHTPPPIPTLRMSKRLEEAPSFNRNAPSAAIDGEGSSFSSGRILLLVGLLVLIGIGAYFGIKYMSSPSETNTENTVQNEAANPAPQTATPPVMDTLAQRPAPAAAPDSGYVVVLGTYNVQALADKRAATLTKNGNQVSVRALDSTTYVVTMHANVAPADTARMKDSLARFFNPKKGVYILH